ncbi:PE-PGRS family protein [Streptomyces populi]|uniref:PE-PGRS family protein n=1 Tax=Streptomyces populi TaxID=2058924 RepID=A0A2I0SSU1_9ACTN|nr:PE-PGRS family protein [Streptomyces populi]PKT72985.1 PE-PGRS family protein [Streptomyces populi]
MAEFRRQPEWQQDANRHTALIDPVLTVRPIARFDYTVRRAVTAIDHALVFVTAKGTYDVYTPPHRPSRSDAATRRYTSVYEVDMGSHPVQLALEMPSDDDAFSFGATADLTWRVADPIAYVASGERDVPTRLTRELHQLARPVSRAFSIEDSPAAERAVQRAVEAGGFAAGIGLSVTCAVRLRLDDEAIAHRRRQRSLRYESDMLDPEHEFRLRLARQQHELEMLRQQQDHHLIAEKINFYQYHLQHGGVAAWALHLSQHPEDTKMVVGSIQKDQLSIIRGQLQAIAGDSMEDFQKAESARSTLRAVDELIQQQTPPAQGALPAGAAPGQPQTPPQPPYPGQSPYPGPSPQPPHTGQTPYGDRPPYDGGRPPYAEQPPYAGQPSYAGQAPYAGQPSYAGDPGGQAPYAGQPPHPGDRPPYAGGPDTGPPVVPGRPDGPAAPYGPPSTTPYPAAGPAPAVPPVPGLPDGARAAVTPAVPDGAPDGEPA